MSPARLRWHQRRMACLDTETTGPNPEEARIVQACVAHVGGGEPTESRTWLVDPGCEIPAEVTAIHGITTEKVRAEGRPSSEAVPWIVLEVLAAAQLEEPLVVMNAPFDLTILAREAEICGVQFSPAQIAVIDPLVLDKHVDPYRKGSRKLEALCNHYGAKLDGAHDATFDAIAAARVAWRIGERFPDLAAMDLGALQELQRDAYRVQAQGLNEYWIKKGDKRRVDNFEWPMRTWKAAAA